MAIKGKELVEKRNILNEVRKNNMSLQELRFFSIYLSKINARDTSTRTVRFPLKDFQRIMEFGRLNTTQLKATTDSLLGKVVSIPTERGGYTSFQLFKECTVDKDEFEQWYVEIDAHDKALPLMFDFKREYFTYELWNALKLRSANQLRMYELLKQYEKAGERKMTLVELRNGLGIGDDEYPRWDRFRDRVLNSCQQALLENTDIKFTYEPVKAGRKITGVHFYISKNNDYVDQLTLDEFIDLQKPVEADYEVIVDEEGDDYEQLEMFESADKFTSEERQEREDICEGFQYEEFDEFEIGELKELRELSKPHIDKAKLFDLYKEYGTGYEAHKSAEDSLIIDYIRQKIAMCDGRGAKIGSRIGFIKNAVAKNYQYGKKEE